MTPQVTDPPTPGPTALEHARDVLRGRPFATCKQGDSDRRQGHPDRRHERRWSSQQPDRDERDQKRQQDGGVETVFAAAIVHGPDREITPAPRWVLSGCGMQRN